MFRTIRRPRQAMTQEQCLEVLKEEKRGVISVIGDDGYPYGTPINHFYNEEDGKIYFHSGMVGHRIDALKENGKVSYCVFAEDYQEPDQWYLHFKSVIIFGHVEFIEDVDEIERICRKLCHKFTDDEDYINEEVGGALKRTSCYVLTIEHMTGKTVTER